MRSVYRVGIVSLLGTVLFAGHAAAAPFQLNPFASLKDIFHKLYAQTDNEGPALQPALAEAKCGGWNPNLKVAFSTQDSAGPPTLVADVTGFPGKKYRPLGDKDSGMARSINVGGALNDGFFFPDTTQGLSTVCTPNQFIVDEDGRPSARLMLWSDEEAKRVDTFVPYPFFRDPPCLWRPDETGPPFAKQIDPPHNEAKCVGFCTWLNQFTYVDCPDENVEEFVVQPAIPGCHDACDPADFPIPGCHDVCDPDIPCGPGLECVNNECLAPGGGNCDGMQCGAGLECVNNECLAPGGGNCDEVTSWRCRLPTPEEPTGGWRTYYTCSREQVTNNWPNCRACTGAECRCPAPGGINACKLAPNGDRYHSFFRKYQGEYERSTVPDVPTDIGQKNVRAACYGFYDEFRPDESFTPLARRSQNHDWRCAVEVEDVADLLDSQTGKSTYTTTHPDEDQDPASLEEIRSIPPPDQNTDLWVPFSGAFSLLQENVFERDYERDLRNVFLDTRMLDTARHRASVQVSQDRPLAKANLIQEFDDSGTGTLVRWWHKQLAEIERLRRPPAIDLLLPPRSVLGTDITAPPFAPEPQPSRSNGDQESRTIRIQMNAGDDIIGSVLRALTLPVEEVPIPLPVYTVSATEINAYRQAWCSRFLRGQDQTRTCSIENMSDTVGAFFQKLDAYAEYGERVRVLRSALARHIGNVLRIQQQIANPVIQALRTYLTADQAVLEEQAVIDGQILQMWKGVEAQYQHFHDDTNLPYCMNQRFTPPAKTLLDSWLPARWEQGSVYEHASFGGELPSLHNMVNRSGSIVVNLTNVRGLDKPLKIAVLKPMIVHVKLPPPPALEEDFTQVQVSLPDLPDLDVIETQFRNVLQALPQVDATNAPTPRIDLPKPLGEARLNQIMGKIGEISNTITQMDGSYIYFWHSILAFAGTARYERPTCALPGGGEANVEPLECCGWKAIPCLPEMDLVPMIARVGSRPLINLFDDIEYRGHPRGFPVSCLDRDPACTLLPPEFTPRPPMWDVYGPDADEGPAQQLRSTIHTLTLPPPLGGMTAPPMNIDKKELVPGMHVPQPSPLIPTP